MVVMKFGGTSVQDASALQRVANIITSHARTGEFVLAVLSATSGTTNALLRIARDAGRAVDVTADIDQIEARHRQILSELSPTSAHNSVDVIIGELRTYVHALRVLGECTDESLDHMASFGERLSTTILHQYLAASDVGARYLDARTVIATSNEFVSARVEMETTTKQCLSTIPPMFDKNSVVITQGFIGATSDGRTTTLGRGGSDFSAALFGAALQAREIRIYTDVSGVYTADPRLVPDAFPIRELSFSEVRELALYGAKVLHPDTIAPAVDASVPVIVLNTFRPEDPGTRIVAHAPSDAHIHAVSLVRPCMMVVCSSAAATQLCNNAVLADKRILESHTLETAMLVFSLPTDESSVALHVACATLDCSVDKVALIATSGPSVTSPSVLSSVVDSLRGIPTVSTVAGAARHTMFTVVPEEAAEQAVRSVHTLIRRP